MGADLIVATARWPQYDTGEAMDPNDGKALETLTRRVDQLTDAYLREIDEAGRAEGLEPEAVRAELHSAVRLMCDGSRETTIHLLDGVRWLIAGGMSWGDEPSDAYRQVMMLDASGITDTPIPREPDEPVRTITLYATVKGDRSPEVWADAIFEAATAEGAVHALRTSLLGITLPTEEADDE